MRHLTHNPISIIHSDDEYAISQQIGDTLVTILVNEDQAAQISKFLVGPKTAAAEADPALDNGFGDFWSMYPRKDAKARALDLWRRSKLSNVKDRVLSHLQSIKQTDQWTKDGGRFIPHASTYLSQKRYLDEVEAADDSLFL